MLVLIAILLALVPALAILYPLLKRQDREVLPEDESSPRAELERRWEAVVANLRSIELERALGNLAEEDYRWLREQSMAEAASIMRAMELEEQEEQEKLSILEQEIREARHRALGQGPIPPPLPNS